MSGGMSSRKIRLNQEALILYDWLCLNSGLNGTLLNSRAFIKWFQNEMGESLSDEQLSEAVEELKSHRLINIIGWQIEPQPFDQQKFYVD